MTYIIAEVGSNWRDFTEAKDSIALAKNCGADAVKFQMFTAQEMYGLDLVDLSLREYSEFNSRMIAIKDWLPKLKEKADACGIDFMCTAFSPEGLRYVDKFVKHHKIASCELNYVQLLQAAKETGKHVYLSVGAASWGDIAKALEVLGKDKVTLMYCSVEYPSTWHNLRIINTLREKFNVPVGFSDHSLDVYTPVTACHIHGGVAVEKHFKAKADIASADSPHSLDPNRFIYMVEMIRDKNAVMKMPNPGEREAVVKHKRRLVVTKDVKVGDRFDFGNNYGTYRLLADDTHGFGGFDWELVNGKLAKKDLTTGQTIGPGDFG